MMHLRPMSFQATLIFVICSWSPVPWLRKQEESRTVIRPNADSISKYIGQQRSLVADSFGKFIWKHRLLLRNGLRTLGMPVRCTCILCYSSKKNLGQSSVQMRIRSASTSGNNGHWWLIPSASLSGNIGYLFGMGCARWACQYDALASYVIPEPVKNYKNKVRHDASSEDVLKHKKATCVRWAPCVTMAKN
ncbi:uncharacterized protein LOC119181455 [Rhipicephalus microplus]|uniref:uncharacterized protein LOC119181455 n=1 Tax=Rhipicephalus microplus TaxID=6941 RepID=UPI003F6BBFD4